MKNLIRISPGDTRIINPASTGGVNRRDLLKGAGLTLAVVSTGSLLGACSDTPDAQATLVPNQYLRIGPDSKITLISPNTEVGQGAYTGLATLLAEELDADWSQIVIEGAPADVKLYGNPAFGGAMQGTGGSTTIKAYWEPMRKAGASARAMLIGAAAARWDVPAAEITISKGVVSHAGSGRSTIFGELVGDASKLDVPTEVKLKDPQDFVLIGRDTPRVDAREKSSGTALFTQDVQLPDMLVAVVVLPPRFGATVKKFDAAAARAMPNVVNVVQFKGTMREGVAVLATDTWSAKKARDAVKVEWDETNAFVMGSDAIFAQYKALAEKPGLEVRKEGDAAAALANGRRFDATYQFPFLAHAAMEPMNCVVQIRADGCEVWNAEQFHTGDQGVIANMLGLAPEQVKINMLYSGGSFGRRGNAFSDYLADTTAIARADGSGRPVKMVWMREDDMRGGFYRPAYLHALSASVDKDGRISAWQQRIVGQSIIEGTPLAAPGAAFDTSSVEGAHNMPYEIPNLQVELHTTKLGVPILWWRAVGSTHTAYAVEAFIDEIARGTNQDPVELRRSLLARHPRHLAVLNLAAEKASWSTELPKGTARGVALHESFDSVVAEIVEVSQKGNGFKVDRVVCVVDCGIAVNPNIVAMQMESGIVYGLTAVATGLISLQDGRVKESNFHDHPVLRINQMPKVEVHIVPSANPPTGVGEPGTPPIGPAVANAIAQLTGKTVQVLPFSSSDVTIV
ncbi:MAG TPA: xanthine dehydrogenase family protein molybdopterin-binding subunit [Steroidobacteraceae bacterium]|nr:xanthine dehydrogenase family protein molybdopterin-binding subunit [Steroidobacteraceae bacterium]